MVTREGTRLGWCSVCSRAGCASYIWRARARSGRGVRKVRGESPGPRSLARPWRREPSRRALMMIESLSPASQVPCLEAVCPWLAFPSRATGGRREPRDRDAGGRSRPSRLLVGSLLRGVRGVRSSVGVRVRAGRSVFVGLWVLDLRMGPEDFGESASGCFRDAA